MPFTGVHTITERLYINDPIKFTEDKENETIVLLTKLFENKCFNDMYIYNIKSVINPDQFIFLPDDVFTGEGYMDTVFDVNYYKLMEDELLPNCKLYKEKNLLMAKYCDEKYGNAEILIVMLINQDYIKEILDLTFGGTIPVKIKQVNYVNLVEYISCAGELFTPEIEMPFMKFRMEKLTVNENILNYIKIIENLFLERKTLNKENLYFFENLYLSSSKKLPKTENTINNWVGFIGKDNYTDIISLIKASQQNETAVSGTWTRGRHIPRSSPCLLKVQNDNSISIKDEKVMIESILLEIIRYNNFMNNICKQGEIPGSKNDKNTFLWDSFINLKEKYIKE